jgi:signal transduction histidine kinase
MSDTPNTPLRVLLVEDCSDDAVRIHTALARCRDARYEIDTVKSRGAALELLGQCEYEVILTDLRLPDAAGVEVLTGLHLAAPRTPIVVLSSNQDHEILLATLDEGAQDYLRKESLTPESLRIAICCAIRRQRLIEELRVANELLTKMNRNLRRSYETAQQFVDNVSHEFRTPLTVIKEFTWLMREQLAGPITEQQARYLDTVASRTDDLALMVDDMLDVSKLKAGLLCVDRRPHDLAGVIEQVVNIVERRACAKKLRVSTDIEADLPPVFCDEEKVRRVILNLAVNSIKFTPESGEVTIWAKLESSLQAVGAQPEGWTPTSDRFVRIGVTDTGPGISKKDQEAIFRRFHQLDAHATGSCKGFGLGLDIARELVGLNLGTIDCQSEPGRGSTFSFTLPTADPETIADVFLDRAAAQQGGNAPVAILEVCTTGKARKRAPDVHEFLTEHICGSDLLYRCSPSRWLILSTRDAQQVDEICGAIHAARAEFNRNSPAGQLAVINIKPIRAGRLPRDRQKMADAFCRLCTAHGGGKASPRQVLIVDDDYEVAEALGVRLSGAGYRVLTAHDGQEGIESAVLHRPDAVLMDIRMPVKDGMTALSELRTHPDTKSLPIIMLSASVRDQQAALDYGARFFIQKPYDAQTVLSALEASMETREEGRTVGA